ncbi:hypothetical protein V8G54_037630 [Vigna mungo]|uniref:Reverse transcriptase Ty1/copia-type domain-containing protein n=1 Tax=Vigna mungo TaxID=3915 RepID=A0AAQ3MJ21_VIGMU
MRKSQGKLIIALYVDDLLVFMSESNTLNQFKMSIEQEFEITDLGLMNYILKMVIPQSFDGIFVSQKMYAKILKKFNICKCIVTPLVGNEKLRPNDIPKPDLIFTSLLSKFMNSPTQVHMGAVKRALKCIKVTTNLGLWFLKKSEILQTTEYRLDRKLTKCKEYHRIYILIWNEVFYWYSKKQTLVKSKDEATI